MAYTKITAEYLVTTPMYLGSSSPSTPSGRIREASFKGALRFWWRAITWHKAYDAAGGNEKRAIAQLRQWEAELFGTASDTGSANSHASPFRLRCHVIEQPEGNDKDPWDGNGWRYLKGQGLARRDAAFAPGTVFEAHLLLSESAHADPLLKSLMALGLFGGIGARSRRGVGSVAIRSLKIDDKREAFIPYSITQLKDTIAWLGIEQVRCPLAPLAAFSDESRVDWITMNIRDFGCIFMNWRSYYESDCEDPNKNPKKKKHPNFQYDHDIILDAVNGKNINSAPKRAVFGLPHNYFYKSVYDRLYKKFRSEGLSHNAAKGRAKILASAQVNYATAFRSGSQKKHERHASPFFIHYHAFKDAEGVIQVFLPNKFVERKIGIKAKKVCDVPFSPDWNVVRKFMNYIKGTQIL